MFRSPIADAVVALVIVLLIFGPKRLPMLSRSVGESIKEFKGGIAKDNDKQLRPSQPAQQKKADSDETRETVV